MYNTIDMMHFNVHKDTGPTCVTCMRHLRACHHLLLIVRKTFFHISQQLDAKYLFSRLSHYNTNYVGNTIELRITGAITFTVVLFSPPVTISSARYPHYAECTSFHRVFNKSELIS